MAKNKRTIYLGLDYSQFTGGVTEVNRKMGLLDAEFKLAQAQAKNYGNETDQLGLKNEYLTQKIALQTQKVEAAKKAYNDAMSSQKASQKEIDALDKKLLQERTALEKLNTELKETEKDTLAADKATQSFGDEIRGIASAIGVNVSPAIESLAKKFDGINASVGNAVLGLGAIASAFIKCTVDAASFADELLTLSAQTGISTDELQKLQYASKFVDVDVSTMTGAVTKLTSSMATAAKGSNDTEKAFRKLHIKVTEQNGELKDANEIFYRVIDNLKGVQNETERDAIAMQIFGKSAKELNPLIEAGSKKLKELGIEADNLGIVMGKGDIEALGKLQDAFDKFDATTTALKNNLGLTLLPIITALFEALAKIPVPVLQTLTILATTIASILLVVKAIKALTDTGKAITNFFSAFDLAGKKTTLIIVGIVAALIALAAIIAVIIGKGNELNATTAQIGNTMGDITGTITGAQNTVRKTQANASGVANFAGGRTWINESGPELVTLPSGSSIQPVTNANETNYYNVTIDAHNVEDFTKIVSICKNLQLAERRI